MTRVDIEQSDVVELIVTHLRRELNLRARTCYETLNPIAPVIPKSGPYFVTVSPGDSLFADGEQAAGNFTEEWTITVTAYSRIHLDSADHDDRLFRDTRRGLYVLKRKILKALVGQDLQNKDRHEFLRDLLFARRASSPQYDTNAGIGWLSIDFGVVFDWEITE